MTSTEPPPIACTLGAGDFKDRVEWIRELSAKSLRGHHRDGLMLELAYDSEGSARACGIRARPSLGDGRCCRRAGTCEALPRLAKARTASRGCTASCELRGR
jgi:hypothetical protein